MALCQQTTTYRQYVFRNSCVMTTIWLEEHHISFLTSHLAPELHSSVQHRKWARPCVTYQADVITMYYYSSNETPPYITSSHCKRIVLEALYHKTSKSLACAVSNATKTNKNLVDIKSTRNTMRSQAAPHIGVFTGSTTISHFLNVASTKLFVVYYRPHFISFPVPTCRL